MAADVPDLCFSIALDRLRRCVMALAVATAAHAAGLPDSSGLVVALKHLHASQRRDAPMRRISRCSPLRSSSSNSSSAVLAWRSAAAVHPDVALAVATPLALSSSSLALRSHPSQRLHDTCSCCKPQAAVGLAHVRKVLDDSTSCSSRLATTRCRRC